MPEEVLDQLGDDDQIADGGEGEGQQPQGDGTPDGQQPQGAEEKPITALFQADGRKLDPEVSKALAKIRQEQPSLGKLLNKTIYRVAELDREFPGGLTEIRELRDKVEELGGFDGITEQLQDAEELNGLAKQFMSADPAFVQDMAESSPDAFKAIAPHFIDMYASLDKEGFAAYIGRVVYGDFQANSLPLLLLRLGDTLGENQRAMEVLGQINTYLGTFKGLAEKAPKATRPAVQPKGEEGEDRETALRSREWQLERGQLHDATKSRAYTAALKGRRPDEEERATIEELYRSRANMLTKKLFPTWETRAQGFIKANNKPAFLRLMKQIYDRVAPEAMTSAVNSALKRPAPAGRNGAQQQQRSQQNGSGNNGSPAGSALAQGFTWGPEPNSYDIDYRRTDEKMLNRNQAVLKDGTKRQWREKR